MQNPHDLHLTFQSTHPLRGGTISGRGTSAAPCHFNPPTPCGVGPLPALVPRYGHGQFQSTHPLRGGTQNMIICRGVMDISIHPPLAGWDGTHAGRVGLGAYFNPPTPCGVGPWEAYGNGKPQLFQSTHPLRGGTNSWPFDMVILDISIHPPLAGWDAPERPKAPNYTNFNPPTPCGVGLPHFAPTFQRFIISIHPPLAGWDPRFLRGRIYRCNFNPPTPCGVGLPLLLVGVQGTQISIHPPLAGWDP